MIKEFINKNKNFVITLEKYIGTGWINKLDFVLNEVIKPVSLEKKTIEESWDYSEYHYFIKKDSTSFLIKIDDDTPIGLILDKSISEINKQKLRELAILIDNEIEKLE